MPRQPYSGSGRPIEGGFLVTNKQDFNSHIQGGAFRHTADMIDMNPSLPTFNETTVQSTLEKLQTAINSDGSGFISIGNADSNADGYADGYAIGDYNVNSTTTFAQAFEQAVQNTRVANGGIILVLAGTYYIDSTITVPPKISVVGEIGGTYLVGHTSDDPLFLVQPAPVIMIEGDTAQHGSPATRTSFENISLFDNLDGYGATLINNPLIKIQQGANIAFRNVGFFGKVNQGAALDRIKTLSAISTLGGITQGTHVSFDFCYFDGLKTPIMFDTKYGDKDFLSVTNSKIRFFGGERASYVPLTDCAVRSSIANIHISNNYIHSNTVHADTLLTLDTTTSIGNSRIVCTNNFGVSNTGTGNVIDNQSGEVNLKCLTANNNWGIASESSWYLTVGGSAGTNPSGDLFGSEAVDIAISWANSLSLQTTIIINPGIYNVKLTTTANANFSKLKLIGNKHGRQYPVLRLNIQSTATDSIGNRNIILGNYLKSLYFDSINSFQSVRPSFDIVGTSSQNSVHLIEVEDCIFINTSLNIFDPGSTFTDQLSNTNIAQISIKNCSFKQTNTFDDNISLVCPRSHQINIENCYFAGNGYAANIGTETYSTASINSTSISLKNVTANLNGQEITKVVPGLLATSSYFVINDSLAKITIDNCQIVANETFGSYTGIASSIHSTASFQKFIAITGKDISILNSAFNGPNQYFTITAINYAMPTLWIYPQANLNLSNIKIVGGGLPLQIVGDLPVTASRGKISIDGCTIEQITSSVSQTAIDFDMIQSASSTLFPQISLTNSFIKSNSVSDPLDIYHTYNAGSTYNCQAFVQIYAKGTDVVVSNNKIIGNIQKPTLNHFINFSGLFINNYDSSVGASINTVSSLIKDNIIQIYINNFTDSNATHSASCYYSKTSQLSIDGNQLIMGNSASISSSIIVCLLIENYLIQHSGSGIVSNNFFSRNNFSGNETSLYGGYINIISTTDVRGQITNNSFSSSTIDGSDSTLIVDNTSTANNWWFDKNTNQDSTLIVRGSYGTIGLRRTADTNYTSVGLPDGITTSNCQFLYTPNGTVTVNFNDTSLDQTFIWSIPLYGLIPPGAYVVSVSVVLDVDTNPTTTSIATLFLKNTSTSTNTSQNPLTTSGITLSLSPSTNSMANLSNKDLTIELSMRVSSSTIVTFTANQMTIIYRY